MPGGIDPHVHMQHPFMIPDGTILYTQGPDRVGMAALYGGTTTLIDFAYMSAEKSVQAAIEARDADFAPKSPCDWAYHLMLSSEPPHTQFAELAEAIQRRLPHHQDLHHQHLAPPHRPHDRLRRHLGDLQGAGARRAASASSTPRTTTSSCTCTPS